MHSSSDDNETARIEIIPLIDVIFFLLATFIMVSLSMSKNRGVPVPLPSPGAPSAAAMADKPVMLTVTDKGDIKLDSQTVKFAQLPMQLQTLKINRKDPKVIVKGDDGANYGDLVAAFDEVRKTGIKVSLNPEK
jgi:biopolymer transport protein ExbD